MWYLYQAGYHFKTVSGTNGKFGDNSFAICYEALQEVDASPTPSFLPKLVLTETYNEKCFQLSISNSIGNNQ